MCRGSLRSTRRGERVRVPWGAQVCSPRSVQGGWGCDYPAWGGVCGGKGQRSLKCSPLHLACAPLAKPVDPSGPEREGLLLTGVLGLLRTSAWERARSCPILCNSMDCSLSGLHVRGISQARILEWVTIFRIFPTGMRAAPHLDACSGRRVRDHWCFIQQ